MEILYNINSKLGKYICLLCSTLILTHLAQSKPISMKEKKLVIKEIKRCLKNQVVFMSDIEKYHDINLIAENFHRGWKLAKEENKRSKTSMDALTHTVLGGHYPYTWANILTTNDREEFKNEMNYILRNMFSHLYIDENLEEAEDSMQLNFSVFHGDFGITYREVAGKTSHRKYRVESLTHGSPAEAEEIRIGDEFRLTSCSSPTFIYKKLPSGLISHELTLKFFRNGKKLKEVTLTRTYSEEYSRDYLSGVDNAISETDNAVKHYETDEKVLRELRRKYDLRPMTDFTMKIDSFSDNEYLGDKIAAEFEFLREKKINNLIIDLRSNLGGDRINLHHLLSFFIEAGKPYGVYVTREAWDAFRNSRIYKRLVPNPIDSRKCVNADFFRCAKDFIFTNYPNLHRFVKPDEHTKNRKLFTGNIVIFTDGDTSSAAETFTSALQCLLKDRCRVIGNKSNGALLSIRDSGVAGNFKVVYPYRDYLTMDGFHVEKNGIKPETEIRDPKDHGAHRRAALKWFESCANPLESRRPNLATRVDSGAEPFSLKNLKTRPTPRATTPPEKPYNSRPLPVPPKGKGPGNNSISPKTTTPGQEPYHCDPLLPVLIDTKPTQKVRKIKGVIVDSYWIALIDQPIPISGKIEIAGRTFVVDEGLTYYHINDGSKVQLLHLPSALLEIPEAYNNRYGVKQIDLPFKGEFEFEDGTTEIIPDTKEKQGIIYSKKINSWVNSVILMEACR